MNSHKKIKKNFFPASFCVICVLLSCAPTSFDENLARKTIMKYYEAKKYKVVEMELGSITSVPLSSKVYMGTEGYAVAIKSITLETSEDAGSPLQYKKGERFTFSNAVVQIREKPGGRGTWVISNISGVALL